MNIKHLTKIASGVRVAVACVLVGWAGGNAESLWAQAASADLSPSLQRVVALSKGGMSEDFINAYINNSGTSFTLSDDEMVNLHKQGVSDNVIKTLIHTSAPVHSPTALAETALPATPASQPVAPVVQPNPAPVVAQQVASIPTTQPTSPYAAPPGIPPVTFVPPPQPAAQYAPQASQPQPPPGSVSAAPGGPVDGPPQGGPEVNFQYFHDQLAPFGAWVEVPGVGMAWQPSQAIIGLSPGWRPYYDNGQWVQTDNGLFWRSDYQWGDIPFHYGRWVLNPSFGWVWVPDYTWGPAWVFWRQAEADGAVGWAALPPGAVFVNGAFMFNGVVVAANFDFGLHEDCFVFVEGGHFHERFFRMRGREWRYHLERERVHAFYNRSVVRNEFHRDEHGRFVNNGIGRERLERMDSHIEHAHFDERRPVGDREKAAHLADNNHHETGGRDDSKMGARTPGGGQNAKTGNSTTANGQASSKGGTYNGSGNNGSKGGSPFGSGGSQFAKSTTGSASQLGGVYRPPASSGSTAHTSTTTTTTTQKKK